MCNILQGRLKRHDSLQIHFGFTFLKVYVIKLVDDLKHLTVRKDNFGKSEKQISTLFASGKRFPNQTGFC